MNSGGILVWWLYFASHYPNTIQIIQYHGDKNSWFHHVSSIFNISKKNTARPQSLHLLALDIFGSTWPESCGSTRFNPPQRTTKNSDPGACWARISGFPHHMRHGRSRKITSIWGFWDILRIFLWEAPFCGFISWESICEFTSKSLELGFFCQSLVAMVLWMIMNSNMIEARRAEIWNQHRMKQHQHLPGSKLHLLLVNPVHKSSIIYCLFGPVTSSLQWAHVIVPITSADVLGRSLRKTAAVAGSAEGGCGAEQATGRLSTIMLTSLPEIGSPQKYGSYKQIQHSPLMIMLIILLFALKCWTYPSYLKFMWHKTASFWRSKSWTLWTERRTMYSSSILALNWSLSASDGWRCPQRKPVELGFKSSLKYIEIMAAL